MTTETFISSKERQLPERTTVYTEVSPHRAEVLIRGELITESPPPLHSPTRWFAELALDHYQPPELKERGVTRKQKIFASPIPYQGHNPIKGSVLLALEVDSKSVYVAEAQHVTDFWHIGSIGIKNIMTLRDLIQAPPTGITQEEFHAKFQAASQENKDQLIEGARKLAENYWKSVVPFTKSQESEMVYEEPEILMTKETEISNIMLYDVD